MALHPPIRSLRRRLRTAPIIHHRLRSSRQLDERELLSVLPVNGPSSSSLSLSELHDDAPEK